LSKVKRNIVIITVLLFVCVAVYLNWSYNNKWGTANSDMVNAEDMAMSDAEEEYMAVEGEEDGMASTEMDPVSDYFAEARLTRQQSRDEALKLLEIAAGNENASQEVIDSAMDEIAVMATWSMQESQIENLLLAKGFSDCVAFINEDKITIAVPAPMEGLSEVEVARITDTITSETDFTLEQINIIEVKAE
jgi:stage III sporulation protein AH